MQKSKQCVNRLALCVERSYLLCGRGKFLAVVQVAKIDARSAKGRFDSWNIVKSFSLCGVCNYV